ncbi:immunoglobulin superfamily member 1-like isoform X4 [Mauremys mutica]|uniref:immunoglobulin superfamily member 1-like isoform X4 n=1 Tax=Mauremys mutica TaxID=74926 RepID=UPI001D164EF6|nr:immunoglobulin superfamily member 1-like isoform X4 [Mauremys mutica]
MVSALTVLLLGCWLAGHSGVWGEPSYPKPSISGIPSEGVSLGGSVSIWCKGQHHAVQFVLNKDGRHLQSVDSDSQALFLISNVSREDGGSYSCSYRSKSEPFKMSDPSDPVELVVRDPELPRPSISLSLTSVTAPGADATIRCQGQRRDVSFFLYKAGDLNPQRHMDPAGDVAEFRIPTMGRQHGGNYSCSYRPRSEPFVSSEPSDPVEIIVSGEGSSSLSRLPAPPPARPTGGLCTDGTLRTRVCPEPWAWQRGHSVVDLGWSHLGVPQPWGSSSHWRFRAGGGGIPTPRGSCRAGAFPRGCSPGCPRTGDAQRSQGPGIGASSWCSRALHPQTAKVPSPPPPPPHLTSASSPERTTSLLLRLPPSACCCKTAVSRHNKLWEVGGRSVVMASQIVPTRGPVRSVGGCPFQCDGPSLGSILSRGQALPPPGAAPL